MTRSGPAQPSLAQLLQCTMLVVNYQCAVISAIALGQSYAEMECRGYEKIKEKKIFVKNMPQAMYIQCNVQLTHSDPDADAEVLSGKSKEKKTRLILIGR